MCCVPPCRAGLGWVPLVLCAPLQGGAGVGPTCAVCPLAGQGWGRSHLCCVPLCRFNFPAMIPLWMFPLAIVTGNTFVLKPSERDPGAAMALVAMAQEAGVPDGVLNVIHGRKSAVDFVCEHPAIRAISFVGSDTVVSLQMLSRCSLFLLCTAHCAHCPLFRASTSTIVGARTASVSSPTWVLRTTPLSTPLRTRSTPSTR